LEGGIRSKAGLINTSEKYDEDDEDNISLIRSERQMTVAEIVSYGQLIQAALTEGIESPLAARGKNEVSTYEKVRDEWMKEMLETERDDGELRQRQDIKQGEIMITVAVDACKEIYIACRNNSNICLNRGSEARFHNRSTRTAAIISNRNG
jgi:hypothetical protein